MFVLDIQTLEDGMNQLQLAPSAADLGIEDPPFEDIVVDLNVDKSDTQILVLFTVSGNAQLTCDRTLKDFRQHVEGSHSVVFDEEFRPEDDDSGSTEVFPLSARDLSLDLTRPVSDTLLLAVPLKRVAPEAEEVELKVVYGKNENSDGIDSRWDALRHLASDDPSKS